MKSWTTKNGKYYEFHTFWDSWAFEKVFRMNGSLTWGWNPYTSWRFGPFELRRYE